MSNSKSKEIKHEKRLAEKRASENYKEHLTNWYMLQLSWGIVGIIALLYIGSLYRNVNTLVHMQTASWIITAVFAAAGLVVFCLGKANVIKNTKRANNYAIFLGVCALFGLWLALYNKIRPVMESAARAVTGNAALSVNSYWNTRLPIIAIAAYLIISFIVYTIKVLKK